MPVMRSNCGFPYTQKPQHEPFGAKFKSKIAASWAPEKQYRSIKKLNIPEGAIKIENYRIINLSIDTN